MKTNTLHDTPRLIEFEDFLTNDECDTIVEMTWQYRAAVFTENGVEHELPSRNSMYVFDAANTLASVRQKIIDTSYPYLSEFNVVDGNYEQLCIQRYQKGQRYEPHFDFFNVPWATTPPIENDRIATMIIYLNDNFDGGHTTFNEWGISVIPKKGKAVFFDYFVSKEETLHGGSEVLEGTKHIITSWIRMYPDRW